MKIYGHPWSTHTRKVLMVLQNLPAHVARHPFAKVPVLEDAGFVLYEVDAINRYLDRTLPGIELVPSDARAAARMTQWISVADSYFVPHAGAFLIETLFRRYLGGESDQRVRESAGAGMQRALDAADRALAETPYLAGAAFSLADVHWLPYLDYLRQTGQQEVVAGREHLQAWLERVVSREAWQLVARSGPQPKEPGLSADVIEKRER
jgi:glutathione S-transferase